MQFDYYDTLKPYRAIISLQTTLEDVSVEEAAFWKYMDFIYNNKCSNCTTPSYLITSVSISRRKSKNAKGYQYRYSVPEYLPFKENNTTPYTMITLVVPYQPNFI
ncbi:MAG: hypothetical protein IPH66_02910 [Crocinitomicaceae bacterium]|nr:hypothetical protein [Crocinitomicaceae bacterium]